MLEDFSFEAPKTKEFVKIAKNLKIDGKKVLLVLASQEKNVFLSLRNVPGASVMNATDINTYALLNNNAIVITEGSLEVINKL